MCTNSTDACAVNNQCRFSPALRAGQSRHCRTASFLRRMCQKIEPPCQTRVRFSVALSHYTTFQTCVRYVVTASHHMSFQACLPCGTYVATASHHISFQACLQITQLYPYTKEMKRTKNSYYSVTQLHSQLVGIVTTVLLSWLYNFD